jgi:hypothetical protein
MGASDGRAPALLEPHLLASVVSAAQAITTSNFGMAQLLVFFFRQESKHFDADLAS